MVNNDAPEGTFLYEGHRAFLIPVRWNNDGCPYMTRGNELVPVLVQKKGKEPLAKYQILHFQVHR